MRAADPSGLGITAYRYGPSVRDSTRTDPDPDVPSESHSSLELKRILRAPDASDSLLTTSRDSN